MLLFVVVEFYKLQKNSASFLFCSMILSIISCYPPSPLLFVFKIHSTHFCSNFQNSFIHTHLFDIRSFFFTLCSFSTLRLVVPAQILVAGPIGCHIRPPRCWMCPLDCVVFLPDQSFYIYPSIRSVSCHHPYSKENTTLLSACF